MIRSPGLSLIFLGLALLLGGTTRAATPIPVYGYKVVHTYPHDTGAYTEGLFYKNGYLYESTGELNRSAATALVVAGIVATLSAAAIRRGV